MPQHLKNVPIIGYTTESGNPVCALDYPGKQVCKLLTSRKWGAIDVCAYTRKDLFRSTEGASGEGYITPDEGCLIWGTAKES